MENNLPQRVITDTDNEIPVCEDHVDDNRIFLDLDNQDPISIIEGKNKKTSKKRLIYDTGSSTSKRLRNENEVDAAYSDVFEFNGKLKRNFSFQQTR